MMRSAIAVVRSFAGAHAPERCDFCAAPLAEPHAHVLDALDGTPRCACAACAMLFPDEGEGRFRRNPRKVQRVEMSCTDAQWSALGIPVGLAWFFRDVSSRICARYPGAAGPVGACADDPQWQQLAGGIEAIGSLEPGVEALLVRRRAQGSDAWRVPMERCWHLAGLLRRHWRGFDGGDELRARLDQFFGELP